MKHKLSIPSHFKYLNEVEDFVQHMIELYDLPVFMQGHFTLAVSESVNNAIFHGNNLDQNKMVKIVVDENKNYLIVTIEDEGEGFDLNNIPDPTCNKYIKNERGRGIFLIKSLADEVEFLNRGSKIKIKFDLSREHQLLFRRH